MKVSNIDELEVIRNPVVTIGIFDGVHKGHRYILQELIKSAERLGGSSVVVSLWPHPRIVLNKDVWNFKLLHSRDEKIAHIEKLGVEHLIFIPFTREIASLPACDFVQEYLVNKLNIHTLLLGYDNRFGKDRQGDPDGLISCARENRFRIEKLDEMADTPGRINSTSIRKRLLEGDLEGASTMLGYDYYLRGTIVTGDRRGRELGFPTANIHPTDPYKLIPLDGVYAVTVNINGDKFRGMLNIGIRPTIDSASAVKTIEVHLLDFNGNLYDKTITIHFISRVRDEMKFSGINALKTQLQEDKIEIEQILKEKG